MRPTKPNLQTNLGHGTYGYGDHKATGARWSRPLSNGAAYEGADNAAEVGSPPARKDA